MMGFLCSSHSIVGVGQVKRLGTTDICYITLPTWIENDGGMPQQNEKWLDFETNNIAFELTLIQVVFGGLRARVFSCTWEALRCAVKI